jgi:hypothetical protein
MHALHSLSLPLRRPHRYPAGAGPRVNAVCSLVHAQAGDVVARVLRAPRLEPHQTRAPAHATLSREPAARRACDTQNRTHVRMSDTWTAPTAPERRGRQYETSIVWSSVQMPTASACHSTWSSKLVRGFAWQSKPATTPAVTARKMDDSWRKTNTDGGASNPATSRTLPLRASTT